MLPSARDSKVPKNVKTPQVQYIDKIIVIPVVMQSRAPTIQTGQRTTELRQTQDPDQKVYVYAPAGSQPYRPSRHNTRQRRLLRASILIDIDVPDLRQREVPTNQKIQKTFERTQGLL